MENNIVNKNSNTLGYKALYLSLTLLGVILVCFVLSGGQFDEQGGIVWLFAGIYCFIFELPIMIASIIFGIKGLKSDIKYPSYISFVINILKIVFVIIIMH